MRLSTAIKVGYDTTFQYSCDNIENEVSGEYGNFIVTYTADCLDNNGKYQHSSIDVSANYPGNVGNCNGILTLGSCLP